MSKQNSNLPELPPDHEDYSSLVHKPINQLAVILPLLIFYHVGQVFVNDNLAVPAKLQMIFRWFGGTAKYLTAFLIIAVLIGQQILRKEKTQICVWAVLATFFEGAVLTLPVVVISWLTGGNWMVLGAVTEAAGSASPTLISILSSFGAGIYEEFIFRLVTISGGSLLLMDLLKLDKKMSAVTLIIISGLIFSASHFSWAELGNPQILNFHKFIFLALAGLWWGVLYVWRGFAVAVCSHICWNLICTYYNT